MGPGSAAASRLDRDFAGDDQPTRPRPRSFFSRWPHSTPLAPRCWFGPLSVDRPDVRRCSCLLTSMVVHGEFETQLENLPAQPENEPLAVMACRGIDTVGPATDPSYGSRQSSQNDRAQTMKTDNVGKARSDRVWLRADECHLDDFAALVARTTNLAAYPLPARSLRTS